MSPDPLVSVIVPTKDRAHWALDAVRSVVAQTYAPIEVLVVENGSATLSPADFESWGPMVRYLRNSVPSLSQARNDGIAAAKGELVALLDDDDLWCPNKLRLQVPCFTDPSVEVVYGDAHVFREQGVSQGLYSQWHSPKSGSVLLPLLLEPFAVCSSLMFRRSSIDRVGGFDPRFTISEEWDLLLRLAATGRFTYVDAPVAWYRLHDRNDSRRHRARLWKEIRVLSERTLALHPGLEREAPAPCLRRRLEIDFHLGVALLRDGHPVEAVAAWFRSWRHPLRFAGVACEEVKAWVDRRWVRSS